MKEQLSGFLHWMSMYLVIILMVLLLAATNAFIQWEAARREKKYFVIADWFISFTIAAGSGLCFYVISKVFTDNMNEVYAITAIGAILGLKGLNALFAVLTEGLKARLGVNTDDSSRKSRND